LTPTPSPAGPGPWCTNTHSKSSRNGHLVKLPIALPEEACKASVENLNRLLAETITLRDVSDGIRANELQVWFVAEHVVDVPLAQAV
jgi:hypothetical protein